MTQTTYTAETAPDNYSFQNETCICGSNECTEGSINAPVGGANSTTVPGLVCTNCSAGMAVKLPSR